MSRQGEPQMPDLGDAFERAVARHRAGALDEADTLYRAVLALDPDHTGALSGRAVIAAATGDDQRARDLLEQAVALCPGAPELHVNLGEVRRRSGDPQGALACFDEALRLQPGNLPALLGRGRALGACDRLEESVVAYEAAALAAPDLAMAHGNLSHARLRVGDAEGARAAAARAVALDGTRAGDHHHLGNALAALGRWAAAAEAYREATRVEPGWADAHLSLGIALRQTGEPEPAHTALRQAERLSGGAAVVHLELGVLAEQRGRLDVAIDAFRAALQADPALVLARYDLGSVLKRVGALTESARLLEEVVAADPLQAEAHASLGSTRLAQGRIDEAARSFRAALRVDPQAARAHANLLLCLTYRDDVGAERLAREHALWAARHVGDTAPRPPATGRIGRRLRIGYVSPDLRAHSVAYFIEPVFRAHDRARVEVFAYAELDAPDAVSRRLEGLVDHWVPTRGLDDLALAERVRNDRIDVLVDLAGHTGNGRLAAFGLRPAPVQITYLGYPCTTGLGAIDLRLVDACTDPPDEPAHDRESLARIDGGLWCYLPSPDAPDVAPAPAEHRGHVTFGSFNALPKLSDATVACWSRVLVAVPGARLALKSPSLGDEATAQATRARFAAHGVDPARIEVHGFVPDERAHLALYGGVDIGLDPVGYNGTTTTCEALWMGVPVLTLRGHRHGARVGASLLSRVGLEELVALAEDDLVARAVALAGDLPRLFRLRRELRERMRRSPLCDAARLAAALESSYERAFDEVLERQPVPPPLPGLRVGVGVDGAPSGWVHVPCPGGDAPVPSALEAMAGQVTELYASRDLERLTPAARLAWLRALRRALRGDGRLLLRAVDAERVARRLALGPASASAHRRHLQALARGAFSEAMARQELRAAGFSTVVSVRLADLTRAGDPPHPFAELEGAHAAGDETPYLHLVVYP